MIITEAAYKALSDLGVPSHISDIYKMIVEKNYYSFGAKDPQRVLSSSILRQARGVVISKGIEPKLFYRAAPATYGLLQWLDTKQTEDIELDETIEENALDDALDSSLFLEEELHRWLYKNLEENGLTALGYGPLRLFDIDKQESSIGKFNTGVVGEIDMLLITVSGEFVIIELKRQSSDKTIGQICRYFGWVREHIAGKNNVYGLILAQEANEQLKYAIKAVNPNISYRQLTIDVQIGESSR